MIQYNLSKEGYDAVLLLIYNLWQYPKINFDIQEVIEQDAYTQSSFDRGLYD